MSQPFDIRNPACCAGFPALRAKIAHMGEPVDITDILPEA